MFMSRRSRYLLMQVVVLAAFFVAVVRLFLVQIVDHRKYVDAASEMRVYDGWSKCYYACDYE